ncbi:MAG: DUF493 domain-containing protein [Lentisphaeria bacterium]|nr:DUF493 domain-containing protein [Lentisphaeria bacterium]
MMENKKGEIQFPCPWELRIIAAGDKTAVVRDELMKLLVADGQVPALSEGNSSAGGKYTALRLTITARSREHLDSFCRSAGAIDGVKMIL